MLIIKIIPARTDNYIYLIHEPVTNKTIVVDPAESDLVLATLNENHWQLDYILNTHHHDDHIAGNQILKQQTGAKIVAPKAELHRIPDIDIAVSDGDVLPVGALDWQVIATPGHTLGHVVFYCAEAKVLMAGDTLFSLGCGRLFEGTAAQMWQSLQRLKQLPTDTAVYCAHEYTLANARFAITLDTDNQALLARFQQVQVLREIFQPSLPSTIGLELATNPFFREDSASIRASLGLSMAEQPSAVFAKIRLLKDQFR